MQSVVSHKLFQIGAVLLIFVAFGAVVVCQFHTYRLDHGYAASGKRHASPSGHAILDFSCLAAVLPISMVFTSLLSFLFFATPLSLKHAILTSPPFKPPKVHLG
ncbi:MAG: hypothetical protein O7G88_10180 [bacterium]|nr:hypothetical protein [bacterium]